MESSLWSIASRKKISKSPQRPINAGSADDAGREEIDRGWRGSALIEEEERSRGSEKDEG